MRKSIALLTTLIFITFLLTIALLNIKKSSSTITIPQDNTILKSIQTTLLKLEINSSNELKKYTNTYPLNYKNFKAIITIEPLSGKINLNQYPKNTLIKIILNKILQKYQVKDISLFENILSDSLDKDSIPRDIQSEIGIDHNLTKDEFQEVIKRYYKITNDKNIFLIPWERYFYFLPKSYKVICGLEDKIISFDCNKTLFVKYKNAKHILIKAKIDYSLQNQESNLSLIYDLKEKKVIKIEKHPIY